MTKDNGGPAFPVQDMSKWQVPGMTLRDYFAAAALQGMCAQGFVPNGALTSRKFEEPDLYVRAAYRLADAMLAELKK